MNHIINDSTLRYLKKLHKDLSEEEIKVKAKLIWDKYVEDNKERLESEARKDKEAFEKSVDSEFISLWMDKNH